MVLSMSNKVISIEIGLHITRICEVEYKKKSPKVYQCISFPTPEDTYEDGFIRNKEKFVEAAKEKIVEAKMKSTRVVFTIASTKIANREIVIPYVRENRIKDIIETNATDYFPVEISEYTITYGILEKIIDGKEKKLRISVLAAPNQLIKNYYSVAKMLGYQVEAVDYIGNSTFQVFKKQVGNETGLIAQIQEDSTLLSIIEGGILTFQRTIQYGTSSITNTLVNGEYYEVSNDNEALQLLSSKGLINRQFESHLEETAAITLECPKEYSGNGLENAARQELTESLYLLVNNIIRVLDYYLSRNEEKKIHTMYLTGQGIKIKGLSELLSNETGIHTEKIKTLYGVTFGKDVNLKAENQGDYLSCIGAAVNPINFIPKDYLITVERKSTVHLRRVLLGGTVAISFIFLLTAFIGYRTELLEKDGLEAQIKELAEAEQIYKSHKEAKNQYSSIKAMYDLTRGNNEQLNTLIAELEEKLPSKSNINTMNITDDQISLNIKTSSKTEAAKVLIQLKSIASLAEVKTESITEQRDENGSITVEFTVSAKYKDNFTEGDQDGDN
jgi:type IV pilus assembly protein PilM